MHNDTIELLKYIDNYCSLYQIRKLLKTLLNTITETELSVREQIYMLKPVKIF